MKGGVILNLTILEESVLFAALGKYLPYCESCLQNQESTNQFSFIRGEINMIQSLQEKIKQDYIEQGGDPSLL